MNIDYVLADGPDWMLPRHLPNTAKEIIKSKINIWKTSIDIPLFKVVLDELNRPGDTNKFIKQDSILNELRSEHWKDHNTELYETMKGFYE
jgi:hypothetical protein